MPKKTINKATPESTSILKAAVNKDWSYCDGKDCERKKDCWRYMNQPIGKGEWVSIISPRDKGYNCDLYIPLHTR